MVLAFCVHDSKSNNKQYECNKKYHKSPYLIYSFFTKHFFNNKNCTANYKDNNTRNTHDMCKFLKKINYFLHYFYPLLLINNAYTRIFKSIRYGTDVMHHAYKQHHNNENTCDYSSISKIIHYIQPFFFSVICIAKAIKIGIIIIKAKFDCISPLTIINSCFKNDSVAFKSSRVARPSKDEFKACTCAFACFSGIPDALNSSYVFNVSILLWLIINSYLANIIPYFLSCQLCNYNQKGFSYGVR